MAVAVLATSLLGSGYAWAGQPSLGSNTNFNGFRFFPSDSLWNKDISADPTDIYSDSIMLAFQTTYLHTDFGATNGMPYTIVSGSQRKALVTEAGGSESDCLMFPIPSNAAIEGGGDGGNGDSHCLVYDRDNGLLYETFATQRLNGGKSFACSSAAVFNVNTNVLRPKYWTSSDAAGLPVLPGLVRGDEVFDRGAINHAIRFTVVHSRNGFLPPATHMAGSGSSVALPPMGVKFRLKASYDISYFPAQSRVIAQALKTYGMILADNGGDLFITGSADSRYTYSLSVLAQISGASLEVVKMVGLVTH
jgi:hypothetical protein